MSIFKGEKGPRRDIVLLNSGCGIYIGGKADSIAEGIKIAAEMIDSGRALEMVGKMVETTRKYA